MMKKSVRKPGRVKRIPFIIAAGYLVVCCLWTLTWNWIKRSSSIDLELWPGLDLVGNLVFYVFAAGVLYFVIRRNNKLLTQAENRLWDLFDRLPIMIVAMDQARQRFTFWNRESERVTGYAAGEVIDSPDAYKKLYLEGRDTLKEEWQQEQDGVRREVQVLPNSKGQERIITWAAAVEPAPPEDSITWRIGMDTTEQQKLHDALRKSEQRFRKFIEQSVDGILVTDESGYIVEWNAGMEQLTGLESIEALGRPMWDVQFGLIHEGRSDFLYERMKASVEALLNVGRAAGDMTIQDLTFLHVDGSLRHAQATVFPIKTDQGFMIGSIIRDTTQLRQIEEEREQLITELDAFAHTTAHDLKNPLNIIYGFVNLLADKENPISEAERQLAIQSINSSTVKMTNIIDELLLLASVRQEDVVKVPLDMAGIVGGTLDRLSFMIEEYQAEIVNLDTWPDALGQPGWVEQVWINYISNALKYGGAPPKIELGATPQPGDMIRYWVRDNGPGIASEDQGRLFTPFTRLPNLERSHVTGYGLGLSIVQRIVHRLGGEVGFESKPGEGSTFYFTLPRAGKK